MNTKKQKVLISLKKANSLCTKVIDMIEKDTYCIDIIQQNLAAIGLLKSANLDLLEGHLHCCVKDAIEQQDTQKTEEMLKELLQVINIAQKK